ncbi:MAG: hypothetical protein RL885_22845 [Planctomycetota bacterium]
MIHASLMALILTLGIRHEEVPSAPVVPTQSALPGVFVQNVGQWETDARFRATLPGQILQVQPDGLELSLVSEGTDDERVRGVRVDMTLENSRDLAAVRGTGERLGRYNYFIGKDAEGWHTDVRSFGGVEIEQVYPGVDLRIHADRGVFEYDLELEAGADLEQVVVRCDGIEKLGIDRVGALCIRTADGLLRQPAPSSWYVLATGKRKSVDVHYRLLGENRFGFVLSVPREPLAMVVDPPIHWSTFLGGGFDPSTFEQVTDLEVLSSGEVVVVGHTSDPWFPTTPGAFDRTVGGCDVFATKLTADGSDLVFSTFLGGAANGCDEPRGLAIGAGGELFITGTAASSDFPVTGGAFQTSPGDNEDAFVTKMNPAGTGLVYSSYLGGTSLDWGYDIAVDDSQRAVVVGRTISFDFPTTNDAFDRTFNDVSAPLPGDAFLTYVSTNGGFLSYSTYFGGDGDDVATAVKLNAGRVANVVGSTGAADFPIRGSLVPDSTHNGSADIFLARFDPNLGPGALVLSTFHGGPGYEGAFSIDLAPDRSIYVSGYTSSSQFPTSGGAFDQSPNGNEDLFVLRFHGNGERLLAATLLGGADKDETRGRLTVDGSGAPIIIGSTRSKDFPTTEGSYAPSFLGGSRDGVIARFSPDLDRLLYSTYFLGGEADEYPRAIQVDDEGVATVAGGVNAGSNSGFPVTEGAWDTRMHGIWDGFITRLSLGPVLKLNGQPKAGQSVSFTVENAFPAHIGNVAQVFLSCSGNAGIPVPGGLELPLSFDFCTAFSVRSPGLFSATIDASGQATTPSLPFPAVIPVGFTLHAAALTIDTTAPRFVSVTCPVEIVAE